jgi:hypothetical protein
VLYLKGAGRCTVHQVRAPTGRKGGSRRLVERGGAVARLRDGARVWRDVRVVLRDREEGCDGAGGLPGVRRKDRAAWHRLCSVGGSRVASRVRLRGGWCRARPGDQARATRERWWSRERGRGQADAHLGHWGLPRRVREREVEGDVRAGSGRERVQGNVPQDKQIRPRGRRDGDLQKSLHARVPM